ncbi:MAG: glycerol-3-phosphate 1-O-acyltransferase PlsY [Thermodesulfobacteriota bacterium]
MNTFFSPVMTAGILTIGAYLLGSIPWGLIFTRLFTRKDIRREGSGNIGATNVRRTAGTLAALLTLAGDVLKGAVPVHLTGLLVFPEPFPRDALTAAVSLAAFLGHLYPVFLKFRTGGKGVATAAGCFAVLCPQALLVALTVFLVAAIASNHVSVGSIAAMLILPAAVWHGGAPPMTVMLAAVISVWVIDRHRDNIRRLRHGTESRIWNRRR